MHLKLSQSIDQEKPRCGQEISDGLKAEYEKYFTEYKSISKKKKPNKTYL